MPAHLTNHIVNKHGFFLSTSSEVDTSKLTECILFASKEDMYKYISKELNIENPEHSLYTLHLEDNNWKLTCDRDISINADLHHDQVIEQYVSNYEM
jgi:hypothetical protein